MWIVFGVASGEKFVIEFSGKETIKDLREILHTEFDQPLDVIIAFRTHSLSDPEMRLSDVPELTDMTEMTLEVVGHTRVRASASRPLQRGPFLFETPVRRKTDSDIVDLMPETVQVIPPLRPMSPIQVPAAVQGLGEGKGQGIRASAGRQSPRAQVKIPKGGKAGPLASGRKGGKK
jgi:hypothetical protein